MKEGRRGKSANLTDLVRPDGLGPEWQWTATREVLIVERLQIYALATA